MPAGEQTLGEILAALEGVIAGRKGADPAQSYTAALLAAGPDKCAKKFGEEAVETIVAALGGDKKEIIAETGDALYHLLVLLAALDISTGDIAGELSRRAGISGHAEKASRDVAP